MRLVRLELLGFLLCASRLVFADVMPLRMESVQDRKAREAADAKKIATCSPSRDETPGPRGTLITYRAVEYDVMPGEVTATPPDAKTPLRAWVRHFYKALRPCLPPDHQLRSPERIPFKLSLFLSNGKLTSAAVLTSDQRVDSKCIEGILQKQEVPALKVATARVLVDMMLAPFCAISHDLQRGDEPPAPYASGFGPRKNRHLIPAPQ